MYRATIEDPTIFTSSWTVEIPLNPSDRPDLRGRLPRGQPRPREHFVGAPRRRARCRGSLAPGGTNMKLTQLSRAIGRALLGATMAAVAGGALPLVGTAQQAANYTVPRTAWGDPDLQGKWPGTDMVGVPMQRDEKLGHAQRAHRRGIRRARAPRCSSRKSRTTPTSSSRTPRARRAATSAAPCRLLRTGSSAASRNAKRP